MAHCADKDIPLEEAMTALDTDYASEPCTSVCGGDGLQEVGEDSDNGLSEEIEKRREKAGVALDAKIVVGPEWRSADVSISTSQETDADDILTLSHQYIAFLRWLTFKHQIGKQIAHRSDKTGESLAKRRRTAADSSKGLRNEFDPPPSLSSDRVPSKKKTPFKSMMADWWLQANPEFTVLEEGGKWLNGFRSRLENKDLHRNDWAHLKEVVAWHKDRQMDTNSEGTSQHEDMENASEPEAGPSTQVV